MICFSFETVSALQGTISWSWFELESGSQNTSFLFAAFSLNHLACTALAMERGCIIGGEVVTHCELVSLWWYRWLVPISMWMSRRKNVSASLHGLINVHLSVDVLKCGTYWHFARISAKKWFDVAFVVNFFLPDQFSFFYGLQNFGRWMIPVIAIAYSELNLTGDWLTFQLCHILWNIQGASSITQVAILDMPWHLMLQCLAKAWVMRLTHTCTL